MIALTDFVESGVREAARVRKAGAGAASSAEWLDVMETLARMVSLIRST